MKRILDRSPSFEPDWKNVLPMPVRQEGKK